MHPFDPAAVAPDADFPSRPVRIVTPFSAGSGPEGAARLVGAALQRLWSQAVTVENLPGGNGFLAIDAFKRGAADGHDLLQLDNAHLLAYPHLFKKLPYDQERDFEQIAPLFKSVFFFVVGADSPYATLGDLIADARANPGRLKYGSWSVGNPAHLGSALLESLAGCEMQHVLVCKEMSQLYGAVAAGELAFALGTAANVSALHRAGRLRLLAIAAPQRAAAFPDVPTAAESGGPADLEVTGWTTLVAPKGLPPARLDRLRRDVERALADPAVEAGYAALGYDPFPQTQQQFAQFLQAESSRFAELIRRAKTSLD